MKTKSTELQELEALFERNEEEIIEDYKTFLRFQSISTDPKYKDHVLSCADWVEEQLEAMEFTCERWETEGHPTLFASFDGAGPEQPTLLLYHHYDVQPVDPLEEWDTDPFEPTVKEGVMYARGAQDNKGQCAYSLAVISQLMKRDETLPINIKYCIEGEEECGSKGLLTLLESKKEQLKADYVAVVDVSIQGPNKPSLALGLRGIVTMDLEVSGPNTDLHSGIHGGIFVNPNTALCQIIAQFHDENGCVRIPDFYEGIEELTEEERSSISFDFDEKEAESTYGRQALGGEKQRAPLERNWLRPTLEINGINGGYSGEGFKTVIPAKASAKISARLVPGMCPKKTGERIAQFIQEVTPEGVESHVHIHEGGGPASRTSPQAHCVQTTAKAYEEVFAKPCAFIFDGGSIHVTPSLQKATGAEVLLMGFGLDTDKIHAPNEHFGLDRFKKGFLTLGRLVQMLQR